jgi:hypothetical protein
MQNRIVVLQQKVTAGELLPGTCCKTTGPNRQ